MLRLGITTLAVFIAGCASGPALPGAGGAVQALPQSASAISPLTGSATELLYVANEAENTVTIYNAEAKSSNPIGTISHGIREPSGLAVDGQQNLYVANTGGNSVTAYERGQATPFETLKDGIISPIDVAAANDGTLYVACSNRSSTAFEVQVFRPKHSKPSETLTNKAFTLIEAVAVDAHDNLYVAASPGGSGFGPFEVFKFNAGSHRGQNMHLQLSQGSVNDIVLGLATDSRSRLVVSGFLSNGTAGFIDAFPRGSKTPSITINPGIGATRIALSTKGSRMYVGDFGNTGYASVPELKYPSGKLLYSFTSSDSMLAVAISPKAPF
jgi:DNA-binding beta-propeller fold protein YncE